MGETASHARDRAAGVAETRAMRRAASVVVLSSTLRAAGTLSPRRPSALLASSGSHDSARWMRLLSIHTASELNCSDRRGRMWAIGGGGEIRVESALPNSFRMCGDIWAPACD